MSKSFKELCEMKVGEFYWENNQRGCIYFMLESAPVVTNTSTGSVEFYGISIDPLDRVVYMQKYSAVENCMHYAPRIDNVMTYMNIPKQHMYREKDLKAIILENQDVEYRSQF